MVQAAGVCVGSFCSATAWNLHDERNVQRVGTSSSGPHKARHDRPSERKQGTLLSPPKIRSWSWHWGWMMRLLVLKRWWTRMTKEMLTRLMLTMSMLRLQLKWKMMRTNLLIYTMMILLALMKTIMMTSKQKLMMMLLLLLLLLLCVYSFLSSLNLSAYCSFCSLVLFVRLLLFLSCVLVRFGHLCDLLLGLVGPEFSGKSSKNPYLHRFVADVCFDVIEEFSVLDAASQPSRTDASPVESAADHFSLATSSPSPASSQSQESNLSQQSAPSTPPMCARKHYWTFTRPGVLDDDSPWLVSNINEALTS